MSQSNVEEGHVKSRPIEVGQHRPISLESFVEYLVQFCDANIGVLPLIRYLGGGLFPLGLKSLHGHGLFRAAQLLDGPIYQREGRFKSLFPLSDGLFELVDVCFHPC